MIQAGGSQVENSESMMEDRRSLRSPILDLKRLDRAHGRERSVIARQIVAECSIEDLRQAAAEIRRRLQDALSLGFAPVKEQEALDKILTAELLEKTPASKLIAVEYQRGLIVKGDKDFVEKTQSSLEEIACVPMGGRLLGSLASRGLTVTIVPSSKTNEARPDNYRTAFAMGKSLRWRDESFKERTIRGCGGGSSATIKYAPNLSSVGYAAAWQRQPPAIWLAHELIHADDAAHGRMDPEMIDGVRNFERQAIGLPPFEMKEFTENRLRSEWSAPQPPRPRY
jgi:hypothetical protein